MGASTLPSLNRETLIAIFLLAFSGLLGWSSLSIRNPGFGTLSPAVWPQIVVTVLALFSFIYLIQSLRLKPDDTPQADRPKGFSGFLAYYRSPLLCFFIYALYLALLPVLGALIGGILLVFFLLNALGGWSAKALLMHALCAVLSMGFMWLLFTFGLRVILPQGEIFTVL
jgi:hypothetical protein